MLNALIEILRGRGADRLKAHDLIAERAQGVMREAGAEYDAALDGARRIAEGLLIGVATSPTGEEIPIRYRWGEEYVNTVIQGGTGAGKSTLAISLLGQEWQANRGAGLIDLKGDLFGSGMRRAAAIAYAMDPAQRAAFIKRLAVVNPFSDDLIPFNVCRPLPGFSREANAFEVAVALEGMWDASLGVHMRSILQHLVMLLSEADLTLNEATQVLRDDLLLSILATRSSQEAVRRFFLTAWETVPRISKDSLLARLEGLFCCENLRLMLGSDDAVNLGGVLDNGDPLFAFFGKGPGVAEEQVETLGHLFLQRLLQATYARGTGCQKRYLLAMDEPHHLFEAPGLTRRLETALTTVRSYGLSLVLIHHNFSQMPTRLIQSVLGNVDCVLLLRTGAKNAALFGDFLPETDAELAVRRMQRSGKLPTSQDVRAHLLEKTQRLPDRMCWLYDHRKPHRAILVQIPDVPEPHKALGISARALDKFIEEHGIRRGGLAVPKQELRRQIEARQQRLRELINPPVHLRSNNESDSSTEQEPQRKSRKRKPQLG